MRFVEILLGALLLNLIDGSPLLQLETTMTTFPIMGFYILVANKCINLSNQYSNPARTAAPVGRRRHLKLMTAGFAGSERAPIRLLNRVVNVLETE